MKKLNYRKSRSNGVCYITSEETEKFINLNAALMGAQIMLNLTFLQGYLTTCTLSPENKRIEVCVHLENKPFPQIPNAYIFTSYDITSHCYWSDFSNSLERVRCITFNFKY